jgi:hypothetical protein
MNLSREGCIRSIQQQLGTWEPSQRLLENMGTKKTCVECLAECYELIRSDEFAVIELYITIK